MRRYIFFISFSVFLSSVLKAQNLISIEKGCAYYGSSKNKQLYVKNCRDTKIIKIIDDVLSTVSLQRNFEIYEANIDNAIATKLNNQRLLIIDPNFLNTIEFKTNDKYSSYLIIAHEIGHHLNSNIEESKNPSPWWDELEADQFAGSVLQKLGISTTTINNVINLIAPSMSYSETHPEWQARIKASINGFCQSEFLEIKRKTELKQKIDKTKIIIEEKLLEDFLNTIVYNKVDWQRNIKYSVTNGKVVKEYETKRLNGGEQTTFLKATDVIDIKNIKKIYLRWHDPSEVAFETSLSKYRTLYDEASSETVKIETFQNEKSINELNRNGYFDNEITISDDLNLLLKLSNYVARLQKYYELSGNELNNEVV